MAEITLKAKKREDFTKSARNNLRKENFVPGVFYMKGNEALSIAIEYNDLKPVVFTSETNIINLEIGEMEAQQCIIKAIQFDPVTDDVLHFDLLGLTKGESLQLQVPVIIKGTAIGIKEGGILQNPMHKLDVECLPRHIPEQIEIEVTNLKFGESISVGDLNIENIKILNPEESIIVSIVAPKIVETDEPDEELLDEEAQEPEVIGKGKADEDENDEEKAD